MDTLTGHCLLPDRSLLQIGGPDAAQFFQNLVTCDVERLEHGMASHGALLTPQGKILFEFIVTRENEGFLVDLATDLAADFIKRIGFYRLRSKVTVEPDTAARKVYACWGDAPPVSAFAVADPRLAALGWRVYGHEGVTGTPGEYEAHRISLGIPEGGKDYAFGEAFPHEALLDQTGGVDFTKGCYVGQEIVSRMQHRGTARSRMILVRGESQLPAMGVQITAADRTVGTMGSSKGSNGLALLRLDKVHEAMEAGHVLMAGELVLRAEIQQFATFGWPKEPTA